MCVAHVGVHDFRDFCLMHGLYYNKHCNFIHLF